MGLTNSDYEAVMREYDSIRYENAELLHNRTKEVYDKIPEIKELEDEVITDFANLAKEALFLSNESYTSSKEELDKKVARLAKRKEELLIAGGFDRAYLNQIYTCPLCKDTGFVDGVKCDCFKAIASRLAHTRQGTYLMADEDADFKDFRADYYSPDDYDSDTEASSRENALAAFALLKAMADDYDSCSRNFVIYGGVGVGKTFLTSALANSLIKSGHSVVFLTAYRFFSIFEKNTFRRGDADETEKIPEVEPIFDCDLLVLDDMGTEIANTFTNSKLFDCLNERILSNKPTIISSNLSPAHIKANYSDRVFSRLIKHYKFLKLTGADIRMAL